MNILYTDEFRRRLQKLPNDVERVYRRQEAIFRKDWRDPRLHVKKLTDHPFPFSFRITRNYRVLFVFVEHSAALFATIGNRRDVYR